MWLGTSVLFKLFNDTVNIEITWCQMINECGAVGEKRVGMGDQNFSN